MFGKLLFAGTLFCIFLFLGFTIQASEKSIYFYYGDGCSHCAKVEDFFNQNNLYDKYDIQKKEVFFDDTARDEFIQLLNKNQIPNDKRGVPVVLIGDSMLSGDKEIIENFVSTADLWLSTDTNKIDENSNPVDKEENKEENVDTPVENKDSSNKYGFESLTIVSVISASLVDAINPCAFAVLILLMTSMIAIGSTETKNTKDKKTAANKKALLTGLSFTTAIFISYLLMGLGVYKALTFININKINTVLGGLAILLGLLNIKDSLWYGKGILMEVPLSWRPKLKKILASVTSPIGAFSIGLTVSLFLLPCTSGPYIIILGMLSQHKLFGEAFSYLVLYNLVFITPMLLLTYLFYKGNDPKKFEELRQNNLRKLHFVAGLILTLMGIYIIFTSI